MRGKTWSQMTEIEREAFDAKLLALKAKLRQPTEARDAKDAVSTGQSRPKASVQGEG